MSSTIQPASVKVWDPFVRVAHWGLAACFAVAYLTAEEEGPDTAGLHIWAGYAVGGIVALRVIWGLIGTGHANFSDFTFSPAAILAYLKDLAGGHPKRYLGHSPAGAAMIFALLICLTGTVATGLAAYGTGGGEATASTARSTLIAPAWAEDENEVEQANEGADSAMGDLHGTLANITLGLVVLHVLGVALSSALHRENLVSAMISGRKRTEV